MNNKKFIAYQLKCWVPILVLSCIFMAIVFWVEVASMNILHRPSEHGPYYDTNGASAILSSIIPAMTLTLIYPFSIFEYRFSKNRADTFLQLPLKEGQLKRTRLNLSLLILLAGYTVTFWIGVIFLLIRCGTTTLSTDYIAAGYTIANYNFLGYLFVYLLSLLFLAAEFYTNAFLVQLGNTSKEGSTYLMMGQMILLLAEFSFHVYIVNGLMMDYYLNYSLPQPSTFSIGTPIYLIYNLFNNYTVGISNVPGFASMAVNEWANFIVPIIVGAGAAVALYLVPDPSGEYYGKPGPRNVWISIIPHVFFFLVGLNIFRLMGIAAAFMIYLLFVLGYYMSLASLYRSFRIPKREIIVMVSVSGAVLVLTAIVYIIWGVTLYNQLA